MSRLIDAEKIDFNEVFIGASEFAKDTREAAQMLIDNQPTVEAKPVVHGEWDENAVPFCNACPLCRSIVERGSVRNGGKLNFCPNCGADMRKKV